MKILLFELILAKIDKYRLVIRYIWGTSVQLCLSLYPLFSLGHSWTLLDTYTLWNFVSLQCEKWRLLTILAEEQMITEKGLTK